MQLDGSFGQGPSRHPAAGRFKRRERLGGHRLPACRWAQPLAEAARVLAECVPPPGRMEVVEAGPPAMKPAAGDETCRRAIKPMGRGRLRAPRPDALAPGAPAPCASIARVRCGACFGCGGDRGPPASVPSMGGGCRWSWRTGSSSTRRQSALRESREIITPRHRERHQIAKNVRVIHDRGEAIGTALTESGGKRRGADRGQGSRGLPNLRRDAGGASAIGAKAQRHLGAAA